MYRTALANLAILVLAGFVGFAVISRFPTPAPADVRYQRHPRHRRASARLVVLGLPADAGWGVRIIAFVALVFRHAQRDRRLRRHRPHARHVEGVKEAAK